MPRSSGVDGRWLRTRGGAAALTPLDGPTMVRTRARIRCTRSPGSATDANGPEDSSMTRQRALSARGRRALGWGLILFLLGQLALALFVEWGHPEIIDPEYGRRLQLLRERRAEAPGRPLVLVLGSSRTAMGFRPEALPPLLAGTHGAP